MFKIEHFGIMSKNTKTLSDWYIRVLNFTLLFQGEGENPTTFIKDENGVVLEFFAAPSDMKYPSDQERKNQHLCLSVSNFNEAKDLLESHGVLFNEKPFTIFKEGEVQFFQDIEGNWIHLVYRPEQVW